MSEIPSIVPAHPFWIAGQTGGFPCDDHLSDAALCSHGQVQELTSTIGIMTNMFPDVTRSSTPLASSFPRFFSRAGELRFLE
jgi:hypothetical protein